MPGPVKSDERRARREERRAEMVQAAMHAVRRHGPGVSVADIAAEAGITKPVLYRHFDDRADLHRAVGYAAAELLMERIAPQLTQERDNVEHVRAVVDAFLAGIEAEPQLWRFVVHNPGERATGAEIVDDVRSSIVQVLTTLIGERLRALKVDSGGAEAWALGLVGMVQSAGDWWLERRTMSRAALTDYLTTLIWGGVSGVLGGADEAAATTLRLLPTATGEGRMTHDGHDEGYTGPAVLVAAGRELPVRVQLDARHEPQDGRLHWFGRLTPDGDAGALAELPAGGELQLRTDGGRAPVRLGEQDPWGRYRVTGVGRPPFARADPLLDED